LFPFSLFDDPKFIIVKSAEMISQISEDQFKELIRHKSFVFNKLFSNGGINTFGESGIFGNSILFTEYAKLFKSSNACFIKIPPNRVIFL